MSKRKLRKDCKKKAVGRANSRRIAVRLAVILALVAVSSASAYLVSPWNSASRNSTSQITPQGLSANAPSKEYIYAGGRLIATEEPVVVTLSAPANLRATTSTATQIQITWNAVTGAVRYELQRTSNYGNPSNHGFTTLSSNITLTSYTDPVSTGNAFIYQVRAFDSASNASPFSNIDLATAISFTEDPIAAGSTTVKAVHITQLRQAVDAVRIASGLSTVSWSDPPPLAQIVNIKKVHIEQLRSNLDAARVTLSLPAPTYTDPTITQFITTVKAAHVQQLRQLVKGYRTVTG